MRKDHFVLMVKWQSGRPRHMSHCNQYGGLLFWKMRRAVVPKPEVTGSINLLTHLDVPLC
eukprot:scaffold12385_cov30-Prasinocladus_malaysianus.AAC.1